MGVLKNEMMENEEIKRDALLAKVLGISYGQLVQTDWDFEEDEVNLDVQFSKNSPTEILRQIKGISSRRRVSIGLNALENTAYLYKEYAQQLGILYNEILMFDTWEIDIENDDEFIFIQFEEDTENYELLSKIKPFIDQSKPNYTVKVRRVD
ncbi:hypothetical protein I5907_16960 [Panacibacter sp. DH6]|uniref:Uncharacterized protein n=1 Tax=Panacibacter microcysteis TaxID=2793269 RepID=A0A931MC76_9BACT|nr:hypothetical protein [Panacibacter microcysteis]MBG9377932.1 hypothetical protein [Panacibacter microcysteis]